ncbi:MAG: hypothetical protein L0241_30470, partial [Planctomycetia bacterium]|nr:hypothetical protein [Planctomycetia bacterium]
MKAPHARLAAPTGFSMPRVGWLLLILVVAAGVAVGAVPRPPADVVVRAAIDSLPADDPFPIRRIRATENQLPELIKQLEPGPTVRLPRPEFESRVRAAGRAVVAAKAGPRVADAAFTAELEGTHLTGTAEIGILNTSGTAGFLPLDPLRLAVRSAKWANGDAVLTVPGGSTTPAVWVDHTPERRVLKLNWSLTGTTEPGERRFELRVPSCPTSTLELNLPAEQVPSAAADVLLTGPFEVPGKPARRLWRLRFGGRSRLDFSVRGGSPSVGSKAKLRARYDLTAGQLTAAFDFDLHPARGSVSEWTFLADPGLRITDIVANNRAGWIVEPPSSPGGPRRVRVNLRQPAPGGKVQITAVAPFPDSARRDASLPTLRPVGAVLEEDRIEIHVAAGLKMEFWSPGDYRLTDATTGADLSRVLLLTGTLLPSGSDEPFRRMPTVRTSPADVDFTTLERLAWHLDATRSVLVARVHLRVRRGPLFHISVRPPAGFTLDRATGASELVSYIAAPSAGGQFVEFARPLWTGQQAELRLEFRAQPVKLDSPVPFPAFAVSGAAERDGWLSITADPAWSVTANPGTGATPGGLWGWLMTDAPSDSRAVYLYRGKEPDGFVTVAAARPNVAAEALLRLDMQNDQWTATTRFTITPTGGGLPAVAVFVPGSLEARTWKLLEANAIVSATAVPSALFHLAPIDPWAGLVATLSAGEGEGTLWLLRFARPLTGTAILETTASVATPSDTAMSLPVPQLLGARQTTRAEVAPTLADRWTVDSAHGKVSARPRPQLSASTWTVTDAYLVTAVGAPGETVAAFGGTVSRSTGGMLPVSLPVGVEVRGVCVAGRWLNPASATASETLSIPIPAGSDVQFEVRYRLPTSEGWPTRAVTSLAPGLPGNPPVRRWWAFAPGVLPGWPSRPWDATPEIPPLLGGPLVGGEPALVTRSDDEWVRAGTAQSADSVAIGLVALILAGGWLAVRRRRARGGVILAGIVIASGAVTQIGPPWWSRAAWPPLCAAGIALAAVIVSVGVRRRVAAPALAITASILLACLFRVLPAIAQPAPQPTPVVVLILPAEQDGSEVVIAPRTVLERLEALARPPLPSAVVTSATYDLKADDTGARITAKFVVYAFRASDNTVSLPLSDARLERAMVDGTPAFPTAPRPDTYVVSVGGAGRHEIEVRFAASVNATGPEREVRFGVPEVPESRLIASLPGAARQPQAVGRIGRQVVTFGDRAVLEAELGSVKFVHLRWREGAGGAAVVKVREGCVWDVSESGAELTSAYLVRVEQGTINTFRFEIPAELDVLRVAARTTDLPASAIALRDWSLASEKGGTRQLRLDFQGPTAGRLLVILECAPSKPITRQPILRFPRVAFGTIKGETDAVYGLRVTKLTVEG